MYRSGSLLSRISRVTPYWAVATLLALAVAGYYGWLGVRYWDATGRTASLRQQIHDLSAPPPADPPNRATLDARLAAEESRGESARAAFGLENPNALMALVTEAAGEAGIDLVSIVAGEASLAPGEAALQTHPLTAVVRGESTEVSRFLAILDRRDPTVGISGLKMSSLDSAPVAQVQIAFHRLPEPLAAE